MPTAIYEKDLAYRKFTMSCLGYPRSAANHNAWAKANIPPYSTINKVRLEIDAKQNLSTSKGDVYLGIKRTGDKDINLTTVSMFYGRNNCVTNKWIRFTSDDSNRAEEKAGLEGVGKPFIDNLTACFQSGTADAGCFNSNWSDAEKFGFMFMSTIARTFSVGRFAIIIDYTPPSYKITTAASPTNGGSVSGGGTYTLNSTANLTATSSTGYVFKQWQDGNT